MVRRGDARDRLYDDPGYVYGTGAFPTHAQLTAAGLGAGGRLSLGYVGPDFSNPKSTQEYSTSSVKPINLFAPNRSHKGTTLNRLALMHSGSLVAYDARAEMTIATYHYRTEVLGQKCLVIDPFGIIPKEAGIPTCRINILGFIDQHSKTFAEDCSIVADGFTIPNPSEDGSFWNQSGLDSLTMTIAASKVNKGDKATLFDATRLYNISRDDFFDTLEGVFEIDEDGNRTANLLKPGLVDSKDRIVSEGANRLSGNDSKTLFNILATVRSNTWFLQSRVMQELFSEDGECLTQLIDGKTTVYIVIPTTYADYHARVIRLLMTICMFIISRSQTFPDPPCLYLWDEVALCGTSKNLINTFGVQAGDGNQPVLVWQDQTQLQRLYPDYWPTIIGNAGVNMVLGCNNLEELKYWSDFSGTTDIRLTSSGSAQNQTSMFKDGNFLSDSDKIVSRNLIPKERIRNMRPFEALFFGANCNPVFGYKAPYYLDSRFRNRDGSPIFGVPPRYKNQPLAPAVDYLRAGNKLPDILAPLIPPT